MRLAEDLGVMWSGFQQGHSPTVLFLALVLNEDGSGGIELEGKMADHPTNVIVHP
jgi:hypothetical protein